MWQNFIIPLNKDFLSGLNGQRWTRSYTGKSLIIFLESGKLIKKYLREKKWPETPNLEKRRIVYMNTL